MGCVNLPEEGVSYRVVIVTEISSSIILDQVPLYIDFVLSFSGKASFPAPFGISASRLRAVELWDVAT